MLWTSYIHLKILFQVLTFEKFEVLMSLQSSARLKLLAEVRSNFSHLSTQPWKTKRVDLNRLTFEEIILCCSNVVNSELLQKPCLRIENFGGLFRFIS